MKTPIAIALGTLAMSISGCDRLELVRGLLSYENTLSSSEQSDTTVTDVTAQQDASGRDAQLLSAFYGLDDSLPGILNWVLCDKAANKDGMPVVFSHEIAAETLQAGDFRVTSESGKIGEIDCVSLPPADDPGELRTVLLVGSYGSIEDQPATVEIIGNLLSIDGALNFKGLSTSVIPLEDGPTISWAEIVAEAQWGLGTQATTLPFGGGSGCPEGTRQVVRVTWAGGVTKPGGTDVDDLERSLYEVSVVESDAGSVVTPFALGDLGDSDNNHELCLDTEADVKAVFFPAGHMTDPREDLNPDTGIAVARSSES